MDTKKETTSNYEIIKTPQGRWCIRVMLDSGKVIGEFFSGHSYSETKTALSKIGKQHSAALTRLANR